MQMDEKWGGLKGTSPEYPDDIYGSSHAPSPATDLNDAWAFAVWVAKKVGDDFSLGYSLESDKTIAHSEFFLDALEKSSKLNSDPFNFLASEISIDPNFTLYLPVNSIIFPISNFFISC